MLIPHLRVEFVSNAFSDSARDLPSHCGSIRNIASQLFDPLHALSAGYAHQILTELPNSPGLTLASNRWTIGRLAYRKALEVSKHYTLLSFGGIQQD